MKKVKYNLILYIGFIYFNLNLLGKGICSRDKDYEDMLEVCDRLNIPAYKVKFIFIYLIFFIIFIYIYYILFSFIIISFKILG
jgi:tRNA U34 2-thiouridine synthase MnmA/TrmU